MIEKIEDFNFTDEQTPEEVAILVKETLGIGFPEMAELLSIQLNEKADEIAKSYNTVCAYGDYGKLLEGDAEIAAFFRREAIKSENWLPHKIVSHSNPNQPELIQFTFLNKA